MKRKTIFRKITVYALSLILAGSSSSYGINAFADEEYAPDEGFTEEAEIYDETDGSFYIPEEEMQEDELVIEELADETQLTAGSQAELQSALNTAAGNGVPTTITITNDFELSGNANSGNQVTVPAGAEVTIRSSEGNQFVITETVEFAYDARGAKHGMLIVDGVCTLENITLDSNHMGRAVVVNNKASVTLESGTVLTNGAENFNSGDGLGVFVVPASSEAKAGSLYIRDGAVICDNIAEGNGGANGIPRGIGVYVGDHGYMEMTGGTITGNLCTGVGNTGVFTSSYSQRGGGVAAHYATVDISGGEISYNSSLNGGGGIHIQNSTVNIHGDAKIEHNLSSIPEMEERSESHGGGIYIFGGTLNIYENASISYNEATTKRSGRFYGCGGGIYIEYGTVNMSGGTLSGNIADFDGIDLESDDELTTYLYDHYLEGCGGGVFVYGGQFNLSGGVVTGNSASANRISTDQGNGGGIYLGFSNGNSGSATAEDYGTFVFTGGTVYGNTASGNGSGVYISDRLTTTTSVIGANASSETVSGELGASPFFGMAGTPVCDNIYLNAPSECTLGSTVTNGDSVICLTGSLYDGADVSVECESPEEGFIVGCGVDGYSASNGDVEYFTSLNEEFICEIDPNGNIVLDYPPGTEKISISSGTANVLSAMYTGSAVRPDSSLTVDGVTLTEGSDYIISWYDNVNAGTGRAVFNGINGYKGTLSAQFTIEPCPLDDPQVTAEEIPDVYYSGNAAEPSLRISCNGTLLEEGVDYETSYSDNTEAGTGYAVVSGTGNFCGTLTVPFVINESTDTMIIMNEDELRAALGQDLGSEGSPAVLIIGADIALVSPVDTSGNTYVSILGNGNVISMDEPAHADSDDPARAMIKITGNSEISADNITFDAEYNGRIIYVSGNASFTAQRNAVLRRGAAAGKTQKELGGQFIYNEGNCVFDGKMELSRSVVRGYGGIYNSGTLTVTDNAVISDILTGFGGGIYNAETGTFYMTGGTVKNCSTTPKAQYGAAVTNLGIFEMTGGAITGNDGPGPAVYNRNTVNMSGGRITGNENTIGTWGVGGRTHAVTGGGVFQMSGSFDMTGGEITENTAIEGGGVLMIGGTFRMSGDGTKISGNKAYDNLVSGTNESNFGNGGGLFINGGTFEMLSGEMKDNTAAFDAVEGRNVTYEGYGGCMFINGGTVKISGGIISGNTGTEVYGSTNALYYGDGNGIYRIEGDSKYPGDAAIVSPVSDPLLMIAGSPRIDDDIFVKQNKYIRIFGKLGDISVHVTPKILNPGYAIAEYDEPAAGQNDFMDQQDAGKFVSEGYTYIFNEAERSIVYGTDLGNCEITVSDVVYTGMTANPDVTVKDGNGNVITGYSKQLVSSDTVNAGQKSILIKGNGFTITGEKTLSYNVLKREITEEIIELDRDYYIYTGEEIFPQVTIRLTRTSTASENEYEVSVSGNIEMGQGTVTVTAKANGNLTGSAVKTFDITEKPEASVTASKTEYELGYGTKDFNLNVRTNSDSAITYKSDNRSVVKVSSDGTVHISGIGECTVTASTGETQEYKPGVLYISIKVEKGNQTVKTPRSSYSLTGATAPFNVNATTTGDGNLTYSSTNSSVVSIDSSGKVTVNGAGTAVITVKASETSGYKESSVSLSVTVTRASQTVTIKAATDNAIKKTRSSAAFNLNAKTTGDGTFTYKSSNTKVATVSTKGVVTIKGVGTADLTVTASKTSKYNSSSAKAKLTVTKGTQTITVKAAGSKTSISKVYSTKAFALNASTSGDGKLTYKSSNTNVATVSSAGKVTMKRYGTAKITVTAAATNQYNKATKSVTLNVRPKKISFSAVVDVSAGKVTAKWSKDIMVTGYQIRYSLNSDMSNAVTKTVKDPNMEQIAITGLTKGKTYYFQLRGYRIINTANNTAVFGDWYSKTIKIGS